MTLNRDATTAVIATALSVAVIGLMWIASRGNLPPKLLEVTMMFVGMLGIGALSAISRYLNPAAQGPVIHISFSVTRARQILENFYLAGFEPLPEVEEEAVPWELTDEMLLSQDPSLALAKLRIDIERELRRVAFEHRIHIAERPISLRRLLDLLVSKGILEKHLLAIFEDILPVCNQAVHGAGVDSGTALEILNIGNDLRDILRGVRHLPVS